MTRQAETGMIQPCSKDGGRRGETEMQGGGGGVWGGDGYREHMAYRRLKGKGTERRGGEGSRRNDRDKDNKWRVYIYATEDFTGGVNRGLY